MKKYLTLFFLLLFLYTNLAFANRPGYGSIYGYGNNQNYTGNKWYKSILPPLRAQTFYSYGKLIFGPPSQIKSNLDIYHTTPRLNNYFPNYPNGYVCPNADIYSGRCR